MSASPGSLHALLAGKRNHGACFRTHAAAGSFVLAHTACSCPIKFGLSFQFPSEVLLALQG